MILSDSLIKKAFHNKALEISPFEEKQIQPASYDFRVGSKAIVSSKTEVVEVDKKGFVSLDAGDFAIILSAEVLRLDNQHVARFGLRSKWARKGLIATTGTQIDPGFHGCLKVGLTNLSTKKIVLSHLEDLLTLEFHQLSEPVEEAYSGPYQGQTTLSNEDMEVAFEREVMSLSEINQTLRSLVSTVKGLKDSVSSMRWILGMGIAIIGIIAALK